MKLPPFALPLTLSLAVLTSPMAFAAGGAKEKTSEPPIDQRLFLLYTLEHLHGKPLPVQPREGLDLRAHLRWRKAMVEDIIAHIEKERLGPARKERLGDEVLQLYKEYHALLLQMSLDAAKLGALYTEHLTPAVDAIRREMAADQARAQAAAMKALLTGFVIPIEKGEPVSIVRTEPLDLSADRAMGPRAHRTLSARGHSLRGATLGSKMWRELGRSAAAGGQ